MNTNTASTTTGHKGGRGRFVFLFDCSVQIITLDLYIKVVNLSCCEGRTSVGDRMVKFNCQTTMLAQGV